MSFCRFRESFRRTACMVICALPFSGATVDAKTLSTEALIEAEKAAVESRKSIESGHFIVSVSYGTFLRDPSYTKLKMRYEIFLNGQDERADVGIYLSGKLGSKSATVSSKNAFIRASLSDDSIIQLFGPATRPTATLETPNPRLLGFVACPFAGINQFGLEEYVLRADRSSLSAELHEHQGEPVVEASYQINVGEETDFFEYRLAVNKGHQPIYVAIWLEVIVSARVTIVYSFASRARPSRSKRSGTGPSFTRIETMITQTLQLDGKTYVILERDVYERLATLAKMPPMPEPDAEGNYPAVEYARASIARGIMQDRIKAGLSQRELAQLAGIRAETLCRIETGKHTASVPTIEKIDRALKKAMPRRPKTKPRKGR